MIKCERCGKIHRPYNSDLQDWIEDHENEIHYDIEQSVRKALAKEDGWTNVDDLFFCPECADKLGDGVVEWIWQDEKEVVSC